MSAGLPVVATDTGAIAETVEDGADRVRGPGGRQRRACRAHRALLADDDLWKSMAEKSVQRYQELFTAERSHRLLADELCRVAATAKRPEEAR